MWTKLKQWWTGSRFPDIRVDLDVRSGRHRTLKERVDELETVVATQTGEIDVLRHSVEALEHRVHDLEDHVESVTNALYDHEKWLISLDPSAPPEWKESPDPTFREKVELMRKRYRPDPEPFEGVLKGWTFKGGSATFGLPSGQEVVPSLDPCAGRCTTVTDPKVSADRVTGNWSNEVGNDGRYLFVANTFPADGLGDVMKAADDWVWDRDQSRFVKVGKEK